MPISLGKPVNEKEVVTKDAVYTRVFYSSFVNRKNASSLLARGNKGQTMMRGHNKSTVDPQQFDTIKSRVVKRRVQPLVSNAGVTILSPLVQEGPSPQPRAHESGGQNNRLHRLVTRVMIVYQIQTKPLVRLVLLREIFLKGNANRTLVQVFQIWLCFMMRV